MYLLRIAVAFSMLSVSYAPTTTQEQSCAEACDRLRGDDGAATALGYQPDRDEAVNSLTCRAACTDELPSPLPGNQITDSVGALASCVNGCVRSSMEDVAATPTQCRQLCSTAVDSSACVTGCMIPESCPRLEPTRPPPTLAPLVTPLLNDSDLLYSIAAAVPDNSSSSSSSSSVFFLLRLDSDQNTVYFSALAFPVELSMKPFACTPVEVSYAVVSACGASLLSPRTQQLHIVPSAAVDITYSFEEDLSFFQHAILTLTWEKPASNFLALCSYELVVRVLEDSSTSDLCPLQETYTAVIDKNATSHTLAGKPGIVNSPPLFDCRYQVELVSVPGDAIGSQDIQITYNAGRPRLNITCSATFVPSTATYDVEAVWFVDPLAVPAISLFNVTLTDLAVQGFRLNTFGTKEVFTSVNVTEYSVVFHMLRVLREEEHKTYNFIVKVIRDQESPFFWRRRLIPQTFLTADECVIPAPPLPPLPITTLTASNLTFFEALNRLELLVEWEPPSLANGELVSYDLRLGTEAIAREVEGAAASKLLRLDDIQPMETMLNISVLVTAGNDTTLFLQMRSENQYLSSSWSDPLLLELAGAMVVPSEQPPPPPLQSSATPNDTQPTANTAAGTALPVYAYVLIGCGAVVVILAGIAALACLLCCRRYCFHRWLKLDDDLIPGAPGGVKHRPLFPLLRPSIADEWEVSTDEIQIFESTPLGKGFFGEVFRGILAGRSTQKVRPAKFSLTCTVAVKRLKKNCTGAEKKAFLKEIDTMKQVSSSEDPLSRFVVHMVGCVTTREPLLLILEFVKHGDLLSYFRSTRRQNQAQLSQQQSVHEEAAPYLDPEGTYAELGPATSSSAADERYAELGALEEKHLLEFARQIAAGMEFLSSFGIVHRDLACRNILIGESRVVKIADFGLSRYVPSEEVYVMTQHGVVLPLRWMAVESIFHRQFTSASDIWSYGVLLWEICTMGGFPYPMHSNKALTGLLKRGYRMERPPNCSPEVYDVMLQCWSEAQDDRPTFADLHAKFDQFLSQHVRDHYPYIELQTVPPYQFDRLAPAAPPTQLGETPSFGLMEESHGKDAAHTPTLRVLSKSALGNRLSMLSNSFQLLGSTPDLVEERGGGGTGLRDPDRQSHISVESLIEGTSEHLNARYVKSPVVATRSSNVVLDHHYDMSIEEELIQHLERRLSDINTKHLAVLVTQDSHTGVREEEEEEEEGGGAGTTVVGQPSILLNGEDTRRRSSQDLAGSGGEGDEVFPSEEKQPQTAGRRRRRREGGGEEFEAKKEVLPLQPPVLGATEASSLSPRVEQQRLRSFSESSKGKRRFPTKSISPSSIQSQV